MWGSGILDKILMLDYLLRAYCSFLWDRVSLQSPGWPLNSQPEPPVCWHPRQEAPPPTSLSQCFHFPVCRFASHPFHRREVSAHNTCPNASHEFNPHHAEHTGILFILNNILNNMSIFVREHVTARLWTQQSTRHSLTQRLWYRSFMNAALFLPPHSPPPTHIHRHE